MSVYTTVSQQQLEIFLADYNVGRLVSFSGISDGIENTNYFVTTDQGKYVLTLFEALNAQELPYFLELMAHLNEHDVPSAHPIPDNHSHYLKTLNQKPAALVQRLTGRSVVAPSAEQCAALGRAMGHLHVVGQSFSRQHENRRGPRWWQETAQQMIPYLDNAQQVLLQDELKFQARHQHDALPRGVIHADLFRDNTLFEGIQLTGIIDFYYACNDVLLYDLAVAVNDWCSLPDGTLDESRSQALLAAYQTERSFTAAEIESWSVMLRAGALRFWLSRLKDKYYPREGEITHIKDPYIFEQILTTRSRDDARLPTAHQTQPCG